MRKNQLSSLNLLAGPYALSWQGHIVFFIASLLALGFFDIDRLGGNFASWFVVFILGYLTTFTLIEVGKRGRGFFTKPEARAFYLLAVLALTGVFRGLVVFYVGSFLGLIPASDFFYRIISAPLFVLTTYVLSNALFASFLMYRDEARKLSQDLQKLNESRNAYEADLQFVNQQQRNRVRELLSAPMWELQKKLETADDPAKLQNALLTMQSINTDVVRPLSHELSASVGQVIAPVETQRSVQKIRFLWPKTINLSEAQSSLMLFVLLLVLGLNSQIALTSIGQGLQIVVVSMLPLTAIFILEKTIFRKSYVAPSVAIFISTLSGLIGSTIGGNLALWLDLPSTDLFWWQAISLVLTIKTGNLVYGIFRAGWQESLNKLLKVNEQQRAVNSRLRQQLWLGQKALAMELHGSVQATLQALALRLSRMQEINLVEIGQVLEQVRKALGRIENQEYLAGQEFNSLLEELKELWDGTAAINWSITSGAKITLDQDLGLARCVFEVIRESVTNAVKHGSASALSIEISLKSNVLLLRIANNGVMTDSGDVSFGSELMNQLCLSSNLKQEGQLVVLEAELALSPVLQESLV